MTETVQPTTVNEIAVYACGGLGINVISRNLRALHENGSKESGFAKVIPYYLDTSDANMAQGLENKYVFTDTDNTPLNGGGKKRSHVVEAVSARAAQLLSKFKPTEFNIIVNSLTGASGSVISPVLVREILNMGKSVVVLTAISSGSVQELENARDTLLSYNAIAEKVGKPIIVRPYIIGDADTIDRMIESDFGYLRGLFSGVNKALDTMDLKNWLNYKGKGVQMQSQLYTLNIIGSTNEHFSPAISVAALAHTHTITPPMDVAYLTVGTPPMSWLSGENKLISDAKPIYYAISDGAYEVCSNIDKMVETKTKSFNNNKQVLAKVSSQSNDDSGLVI